MHVMMRGPFVGALFFPILIALYSRVCLVAVADTTESIEGSGNGNVDNPDAELIDDPYTSYMLWPHLHFSGVYRADVSTVNKQPSHYDTIKFGPADQLPNPHTLNFNPKGSDDWSIHSRVTRLCYADGLCLGDEEGNHSIEPVLGAPIQNSLSQATTKLIDLDVQAQMFPEIWGWRIGIGNLFSADCTPVPFQYQWKKMTAKQNNSRVFGSAYQSVLSNIAWANDGNGSRFIKQLRRVMNNENIDGEKLSIRFNVDMYNDDAKEGSFTYGRLTGTIGLLGKKSPPFFTHGRMLRSLSTHLQDAPFYVDQAKGKVFMDLGNSLPINQCGAFDASVINDLVVAVSLDRNPSPTCSDKFLWLGQVYYNSPKWYQTTAGIQVFPSLGKLPADLIETIRQHPLVVAEVNGYCKKIVMAEAPNGVDIRPYSKWTFRKEPGERATLQLIATKFGRPLSSAVVKLDTCNLNCESFTKGGPAIGQPHLPDVTPILSHTNKDGMATFDIHTVDPQNSRKFIDGQIYFLRFSMEGRNLTDCLNMCRKDSFKLLDSLTAIRVFDSYTVDGEPTWLDDIYPIFKQYANLYPLMTEKFIDLGSYYRVIKYRHRTQKCLELPMSSPCYMRDLSASKREVILNWLKQEKPLVGKSKSNSDYNVQDLRNDLQTALEIEHAIIPPYLTAWASIKDSNSEVHKILKEILIQEMMHMALVGNILNAVGGRPSLYSPSFIPSYPSPLPGKVQPNLVVPIKKISRSLLKEVFLIIEQPECELREEYQHVWKYIDRTKPSHCVEKENGLFCEEQMEERKYVEYQCLHPSDRKHIKEFGLRGYQFNSLERLRKKMLEAGLKKSKNQYPSDIEGGVIHHEDTIGGFYHHILTALGILTDCGMNNSIFTGDQAKQITHNGWKLYSHENISVLDFKTAADAIRTIVDQGEGSDICNPFAWNEANETQLSHYFLFKSIVEGHRLEIDEEHPQEPCNVSFKYSGPEIHFDPNDVWPMIDNPKMEDYKPDSIACKRAEDFDREYTKLLKELDNIFNGSPNSLESAIHTMFKIARNLEELLKTPINGSGNAEGPNAGPTFNFKL